MSWPRLIVITDRTRGPLDSWLAQLEGLLERARAGSVEVMLRDPELPVSERYQLGQLLRGMTQRYGQSLSVSDRLDLALLLDAQAVHLSEASVAPADARAFARSRGRSFRVSAACHAPERCITATEDALLVSPIMATRKGRPALGASVFGHMRRQMARRRAPELGPCRLYALGGVTAGDAGMLRAAGADGVALIGELFEAGAPRALVTALRIER